MLRVMPKCRPFWPWCRLRSGLSQVLGQLEHEMVLLAGSGTTVQDPQ